MERGITTIQLHERVKHVLDNLKETNKESYEDVILNLIKRVERQRRIQSGLLAEGYIEMAKESRKTTREWSKTETGWD